MRRLRWHYFIESVRISYTARAFNPDGWCAFCGGKAEFTRTRIEAWAWIVKRSWRIAVDDARLATLLELGADILDITPAETIDES